MSNQQLHRREACEQPYRREASEQQHRREAPLPITISLHDQDKDQFDSPLTVTQWLRSVRKRTSNSNSGFPRSSSTIPFSFGESVEDAEIDMLRDTSVWDRLGKAEMLDIESSSFSWDTLSSLHHTEHTSCNQHSEDETNRALEITVNSGGVVFFALFNVDGSDDDTSSKEAAAVIKISSSRMATQSERLGYEFAKWLGVQAPQARVIHNTSLEWLQIKKAAEKARDAASCESNVIGETTCSELLEALELSRCLLFMSYVHGSPLLESSSAFESKDSAERTSAALGRVMMLDLVIRNEDRLPCRQLRWRGNPANLLLAEKAIPSNLDSIGETFDLTINRYELGVVEKKKRSTSRLCSRDNRIRSQGSHLSHIRESSNYMCLKSQTSGEPMFTGFNIVAIDSGVPRRPPAVKRANDQVSYPKLVELVLNSSEFSSCMLHDITGGKLGSPPLEDITLTVDVPGSAVTSIVHEFRSGFRAALRDLQGFHIFLLTLHQKLDNLLRLFNNTISKVSLGESENGDSPSSPAAGKCLSSTSKGRFSNDSHRDFSDSDSQNSAPRALSSSGNRNFCDSVSPTPMSRGGCHGKSSKGSVEPLHDSRFTAKLRDFYKFAKVDAESYKELEHWNEMLKNDAIKLCQENNFNSGFFEGSDSNTIVDAYELKIRLEHILERIALISEAANTERPSPITNYLFIGGVLSARSIYTMQHLGITHILCLCTNEIGQSDSQFPDLFTYKNFFVLDTENTNISILFDEACDFIEDVERTGQRILVHCFEGKSRSVTVVLAYLMLRKNYTLLEAWNVMKKVHRRAQPNDGFGKILQELDLKLHGKVSMEWRQRRRPTMKVCPICGKNAGLSSSSLKLHLQKSHKRLSSGSVDSAMTMEIQKTLTTLNISRGVNVSPTHRQSHSMTD